LFHVFDQYLSFDYGKYQNFDFVIKTHWSSVFDVNRLLVVPIGYESDMPFRQDFVPASRRSLLWSFAGVLKSSRYEMVRALEDMRPNCIHAAETKDQRLPKSRYVELLQSSVFAPCPMGNVIMESFRLYESLEAGCIPILEKRFFIKYYEHLLDSPPLLFVWTWKEAKQKMAELTADPAALDHVQRETQEWWQQYKSALRERVQQFVAAGFAPERSSGEGVRVSSMTRLPGWNYAELLRHQSPPALLWRIQRNLLRGA
jgi:hypothetical protein